MVMISLCQLGNWMQLVLDRLGLGCALLHTGHSASFLNRRRRYNEVVVFSVIRVSLSIIKLSIDIAIESAPLLAQRWMNVAKCLRGSSFSLHRGRLSQIYAVWR